MFDESKIVPSPTERVVAPEVRVRALNPENPYDLEIARNLDLASLEALNPFTQEIDPEKAHEAQTEQQLTRWMSERNTGMLRIVEDSAGKAVGFVYLYNDTKTDSDFRRRAQALRMKEGLPSNHSVWEMNFWFYEGTADAIVKKGVEGVLHEFAGKRAREATTVMFADAGDVKEAYKERTGDRLKLQEIAKDPTIVKQTTEAFQDSRVLEQIGFQFVDRIRYTAGDRTLLDFAYARRIGPHTSL